MQGKGLFIPPTVFDGVTSAMTIGREEIFGPVLAVFGFDSEEEAATSLITARRNTPNSRQHGCRLLPDKAATVNKHQGIRHVTRNNTVHYLCIVFV